MLRKLLVALILVVLPACGGDGGVVDEDLGPPGTLAPSGPLVVLLRYGGIAGSNDRVSVDALGVATVISDRSDNSTTRTLSPSNLAALRARSGERTSRVSGGTTSIARPETRTSTTSPTRASL